MIDVGAKSVCFACDECGIHEQIERRMQVARELGENLQYDHCSCDKVGDEFWAGGYCEDAFAEKPSKRNEVRRKTGRAYRRKMRRKTIKKYRIRDGQGWSFGPEAQNTRCSSSVCRTRQSAGMKASRSRGTDTVRCSTTGGRLLGWKIESVGKNE